MGEIDRPKGNQFENPQQPRRNLLPIGWRAIKNTLQYFPEHEDGEAITDARMSHLRNRDGHYAALMTNFFALSNMDEEHFKAYNYGVIAFVEILEEQARQAGLQVPKLVDTDERNDSKTIWDAERAELKRIGQDHPKLKETDIPGIAAHRIINLSNELEGDTELGTAILRHTDGYSGQAAFLVGFMFAYDAMKIVLKLQDQEKFSNANIDAEIASWEKDPGLSILQERFKIISPITPDELRTPNRAGHLSTNPYALQMMYKGINAHLRKNSE